MLFSGLILPNCNYFGGMDTITLSYNRLHVLTLSHQSGDSWWKTFYAIQSRSSFLLALNFHNQIIATVRNFVKIMYIIIFVQYFFFM